MLGRLEIEVDGCISAYSELSHKIFKKSSFPLDLKGKVKGKYPATELPNAVKKIIRESGSSEDALLDDGKHRSCHVYFTKLNFNRVELTNSADSCVQSEKRLKA